MKLRGVDFVLQFNTGEHGGIGLTNATDTGQDSPEGARSRPGAVAEAQRWHLCHADFAAGDAAILASDDATIVIDQDREIKAQSLAAVGDLPISLVAVVPPGGGVRLESADCPINDQHPRRKARRLSARSAKVLHRQILHENRRCGCVGLENPATPRVGFLQTASGWPRQAFSLRIKGRGMGRAAVRGRAAGSVVPADRNTKGR